MGELEGVMVEVVEGERMNNDLLNNGKRMMNDSLMTNSRITINLLMTIGGMMTNG